jgi:ABC-type phosphonate transport system ATPase subunit
MAGNAVSTDAAAAATGMGSEIIVECTARRLGPDCPFGNDEIRFSLRPGGCVCFTGASGRGKTTIASAVAGLSQRLVSQRLHLALDCRWNSQILPSERCGVLL